MNRTRRIAVLTGAAATAALGTIGVATPATAATPTVVQVVDAAPAPDPGATIRTTDGRAVTVRGFPDTHYRADASHRSVVVQLAASSSGMEGNTPGAPNMPTPLYPQQPQAPGYNPQQIQTQAGGGAISVTVAIGMGLAIFTFVMVKKGRINGWHAAALVMFGVFLAPTTFGPVLQNLGISLGSGLGNVWAGF